MRACARADVPFWYELLPPADAAKITSRGVVLRAVPSFLVQGFQVPQTQKQNSK